MMLMIMAGFTLIGVAIWWTLGSPNIIHAPDGESPLRYWWKWREKRRILQRMGTLELFFITAGIGLIIGGLAGLLTS